MPPLGSEVFEFISYSAEQTTQVGFRLGGLLQAGDVICLTGHLGAGKTTFTRGVGQGWGALEAVTSPTFTLIHEHRRSQDDQVLYHVDCYRLHDSSDAWSIGLDDVLYGNGSVVIEWPEHVQDALPEDCLWIAFTLVDDTQRRIMIQGAHERNRSLVENLRQHVFGK